MSLRERAITVLANLQERLSAPLEKEFSVSEDAIFRKFKLFPFSPDKLIKRKGFKIYEQMVTDDQIAQSLGALKIMRLSSDWEILPASDSPRHMEQRDFAEWNLTEFIQGSFHDDLYETMGALEFGWSLSELVWSRIEKGMWAGKIGLKAIKNKKPTEYNILVDDHDNIEPDGVCKITFPGLGDRYPTDKFVIYSWRKKYEGVFGTSILRSLYDLWWIKHVVKRALGVYLERYGVPLALGKYPSSFKTKDQDDLFKMLKQIRLESAATIPKDVELVFQEASGRGQGQKLFIDTIKHIDEQITKTILGQTLTSSTSGVGSQALGRVHKDILTLYLEELGFDLAEKAINPQIIRRMIDINFADVDEYPRFEFKSISPKDQMPLLDKYYAGVEKKVIIPTKEDEAKIREIISFPERTEDSEPILPRPEGEEPAPDFAPKEPPPQIPGNAPEAEAPAEGTATRPPEAPAGQPNANLAECGHYAEQLFTGVTRRTFTQAEKRVDFQEAIRTIEVTGVEDITTELTPILNEAVDKILRDVKRKKILDNKDLTGLRKLRLVGVGEMRRIINDGLARVARRGLKGARQELQKARKQAKLQEPEDISQFTPEQILRIFKDRAFAMAGTVSDQVLQIAQQVIAQGIKNGQSFREVANALRERLQPFLDRDAIDPIAASGGRLDTTVRTNVVDAFNMARREEFRRDTDFVPFLQYSAILDDRVRPNHRAMDGREYRTDNRIWDDWTPPNGFNCRCLIVPLTVLDERVKESPPPPANVKPDKGFGAAGK